jgi:glycosyltransferase involved in cell wall biosynthesis
VPPAPRPPRALIHRRRGRAVRVLLVSYAFPPANRIGAVRLGKLAKYLCAAGHEVRVIAAPATDASLALEIPAEFVRYAPGWAVDAIFDGVTRELRRLWRATIAARGQPVSGAEGAEADGAAGGKGWRAALARHYHALMHIPDARGGWIGAATAAGYELIRSWRPDIVLGSAPPASGLVAAARIARVCGAPFVAELRDLWVDDPYYDEPAWRLPIDRLIERRVLSQAAGLVSVTPRWSAVLQRRYRQPVACIMNGYVETDFPRHPPGPPPGEVVCLVYTGNLYQGYRDPTPLFAALALLGEERRKVAVHFYGPHPDEIMPLARRHGVADRVFVHPPVPYKESLAVQQRADILLLLQWNNVKDAGNIPAKFFEYIGAQRPILLLGYPHGDLAAMLRERAAGVVANEPEAIARCLREWIARKAQGIPNVDPAAMRGLGREAQYRRYETFLYRLLDQRPPRCDPPHRAIRTGIFASMMMWRVAPPKII